MSMHVACNGRYKKANRSAVFVPVPPLTQAVPKLGSEELAAKSVGSVSFTGAVLLEESNVREGSES
jgi:hypothetical protein